MGTISGTTANTPTPCVVCGRDVPRGEGTCVGPDKASCRPIVVSGLAR